MTGEFSEHYVDAEDGQHQHSNGIFVVTSVFGNPVIGVATDYRLKIPKMTFFTGMMTCRTLSKWRLYLKERCPLKLFH